MKGLIKKDFYIIKQNMKYILLFLAVFGIIALEGDNILYFIPVFLITMIFITTFSYDDYNNWDAYAVTLPNGRKNVVKSKYIASITLTVFSTLITYILSVIIGGINGNLDLSNMTSLILSGLFSVILIQAIMYPLIFKFGAEKGRIWLFVGVFLSVTIISIIFKNISIPASIITFFSNYYVILLLSFIVVAMTISYIVSKKIYSKKEF